MLYLFKFLIPGSGMHHRLEFECKDNIIFQIFLQINANGRATASE